MAIIAQWHRNKKYRTLKKTSIAILGSFAVGCLATTVASADTINGTVGIPGAVAPGTPSTAPPPLWNNIQNEYVFCNVGYAGTFTFPTGVTRPLAGRISFGNTGGSPFTAKDDLRNLCGWSDVGGLGSSSPYPCSATNVVDDWPAYLRVNVDGTQRNVGFATTDTLLAPQFRQLPNGPALVSEYTIGTNLRIRQEVRVRRAMLRFEWTIINDDTNAHSVSLRWNISARSATGFYFNDNGLGVKGYLGESNQANQYTGGQIPDNLTIFNRRADDISATTPSFAMRQIFRGADATLPTKVVVANADNLWPGDTTASGAYDIDVTNVNIFPYFLSGIATAAYYNTVNVAPGGGRSTVVAYAGNGTETQQIGTGDPAGATTPDYVIGGGGPESLVYNTSAALDPTVIANKSNPTLASVGAAFITTPEAEPANPRRFRVTASLYNQTSPNPLFGVRLDGVSLSLTLPQGLKFSVDPATNAQDIASKSATGGGGSGAVSPDKDGQASWWVEATGERYGPLTYQITASVQLPSPLSRSISRTIVVPTPPVFSYKPQVFQLTGIPFTFDAQLSDKGLPATVLNTNVANQEVSLSLWEYSGVPGRPYQLATQIVPGRGYFYRPSIPSGSDSNARIVLLKGVKPVELQAPTGNAVAQPARIQLETGWNLVANPYVYEIPLNYFRFIKNDEQPLVKNGYQASVNGGTIRGGVYTYNSATRSYDILQDISSPIIPWQGYWIYANQRVVLEFTTPTTRGALIQPTPLTATNTESEPGTRLVNRENDWRQQMVVRRDDGATDSAIYLGGAASLNRVGGDDSRNLPKPPPIADYIYGGLVKSGETTRYARVLQSAGSKQQAWELEVVSDKDGTASISWPNIARLPRRVQLQITDMQTGRTQNLRSTSALSVAVRKGVATRYRITAGREASQTLRITSLQTTQSRGAQSISIQVNKEATITARVLTQTGRAVQILASGRAAASGSPTVLSWNQRDQSGNALPAGVYVVEVVATGGDGEQPVRLSRAISVLR